VRTVRISKYGSAFCYPEHIDREMKRLFASLKKQRFLSDLSARDFAVEAAHVLAELNAAIRSAKGMAGPSFHS
jgi:cell filamentation protein